MKFCIIRRKSDGFILARNFEIESSMTFSGTGWLSTSTCFEKFARCIEDKYNSTLMIFENYISANKYITERRRDQNELEIVNIGEINENSTN